MLRRACSQVKTTTDINVVFERGSPVGIDALLVLKSADEWDRFMRWMQRYAAGHDLSFEGAAVRAPVEPG